MSYQVFVSDLKKEPLTTSRLQEVWEFCNLKNKSPLIDVLTKALFMDLKKRSDRTGIPVNELSIPVDDVCKMCDRFYNAMIKKTIPPTIPLLDNIPITVQNADTTWRYNPATGIVFRPDDQYKWVAIRAMKGNRLYPLNISHLTVCVGNGWYFDTTIESITSPYRV